MPKNQDDAFSVYNKLKPLDIKEKNAIPQVDKSITNINNATSFTETDTATVKIGDIVEIKFGDKVSKFQIVKVPEKQVKDVTELIKIL